MAKKKTEVVTDDEHAKLLRWVNEADDSTLETRTSADKARNYYDSRQWTDDEIAVLKKRKQAATTINRIKPKIDTLMGMEKAAKTTAKAFPRTPKHEQASEACTEAVRFVLQDNQFDQVKSSAWENLLIEGTCGAEIVVKPNREEGYKIVIRHLMWDRLIYDPHSRRKDFSDARYLGQVVWMDYDEAVSMYPDASEILQTMQTGSSTYDDQPRWMDNTRKRVKIVELYYQKANGAIWYCCFTYGGYCIKPKISPYVDEEGYTEWPYEFGSLFVTREGGRYGAVLQLLDPQDDLNKRRSKFQHLLSVRQIRLERGAVEDVNKVRQELAKPDGVIETTPGMEFEVLKTGDMAAAQFQLYQDSKLEMDIVGANSTLQGKGNADASGVALRARAQAGQTEIGPMFDVLRNWQLRIYRKVWNCVRKYWKDEMWIRVTDDETNLRWVGLNKPITAGEQLLQKAQEQGIEGPELQQLQERIAQDPEMKQVVDTHNDVADLDMDIILTEVPDVLTQQQEDFQAMAEMVKSGFPIPPLAVILASPLSNKDQIIKMMKETPQLPPQLQQQMQQMQEAAQKLQEENKALAQENQKLKTSDETDRAKFDAQHKLKVAEATEAHNARMLEIDRNAQAAEKKARIDAAVKITTAQIAAKGALTTTEIQAEADANIELAKLFHDRQKHSESLGAEKDMHAAGLEADQGMHESGLEADKEMHGSQLEADAAQATEEAAKPANTPIAKMTQMHEEGLRATKEGMSEMAAAIKAMAQAVEKLAQPKEEKARSITLVKKNGETVGATVQ